MTLLLDVMSAILLIAGSYFFTSGTIGLIRFPDVRSQLHALTKADNLGLGLILLAVAIQIGSWTSAGVLLLTWLLALGAASVSAQVISGAQLNLNNSPLRVAAEGRLTANRHPDPDNADGNKEHPSLKSSARSSESAISDNDETFPGSEGREAF